jgi:crotonobetainyl-CoA:carnitine CoA-transferase CaiB-like acyl-CoA transferase
MRPFEGMKVVDLTHVLAGPFCTYQMALLGADVIKIEDPRDGDYMRRRGSDESLRDAGMGDHFLCQNANKRSLALDLKSHEGRSIVRRLCRASDVVVTNYRAGALEDLELGYERLAAENQRLVYCTLTAYGATGPMGPRRAYDNVVQAMSGMMATTGTPETGPLKAGTPVLDYASGAMAAFAVSAALLARERSGRGQLIDLSMMDTALLLMSPSIMSWIVGGRPARPHGNDHALAAASCYETADGALLMLGCCTQAQFDHLCRLIGREDLLGDARFASVRHQDPHRDDLARELAPVFRGKTAEQWETLLAEQVPVARVRSLEEALALEQLAQRPVLAKTRIAGREMAIPCAAFTLSEDGPQLDRPPPGLGEHTREVLDGLGLGDREIEDLLARGIIGVPAP